MALGMTISLLELNTLVHAICALVLYILWWRKPLDVEGPTLIDGNDADILCAGMCMRNRLRARLPITNGTTGPNRPPRYQVLRYGPPGPPSPRKHRWDHPHLLGRCQFKINPPTEETLPFKLYTGQRLYDFVLECQRARVRIERVGILCLWREYMPLSAADVRRLWLAKECYTKYPDLADKYSIGYIDSYWVLDRSRNWPISPSKYDNTSFASTIPLGLFIAGLAYGGLHLLAWSPPVRTVEEAFLWRFSGVTIAVYGAVAQLLSCCFIIKDGGNAELRQCLERLFDTLAKFEKLLRQFLDTKTFKVPSHRPS